MEINEKLEDHERRLALLEEQLKRLMGSPNVSVPGSFSFSDRKKGHNELLEELLKSNNCHSRNGLSFEEIVEIFKVNGRPVNLKKLRDLLGVWK